MWQVPSAKRSELMVDCYSLFVRKEPGNALGFEVALFKLAR
jgi:hypothetical protein